MGATRTHVVEQPGVTLLYELSIRPIQSDADSAPKHPSHLHTSQACPTATHEWNKI